MLKMFDQIYKNIISENIFNEKTFPVTFEGRPVEVYECLKNVEKVPKEFGLWPSLQKRKCFYTSPLREHEARRVGPKIGVNEIVILKWKSKQSWGTTPKQLLWVSYDFVLPDFKPLIDNGYVRKNDLNPAEEFIIDYVSDNLFNMWKAPVQNNFEDSKNDKEFQEIIKACTNKNVARTFVGHDLEDLINL